MHVYATKHKFSTVICNAFAEGVSLKPTPVAGGLLGQKGDDVVTYGLLRGCLEIWHQARCEGRTWWYMDNGYVGSGHFDGFYSVAKNAFQHDGSGDYARGYVRAKKLGLEVKRPYANRGHILLVPPTEVFASLMGFFAEEWVKNTTKKINDISDRKVKLRLKPGSRWNGKIVPKGLPLEEDLEDAHALVTYNSKVSVEATKWGVPVISTIQEIATSIGSCSLRDIETRRDVDDRERWFAAVAANQWTLDEMRSGQCWRDIQGDEAAGLMTRACGEAPIPRFF